MADRSNTLETVLLALELLRRIPRDRKVTARQLHEQLRNTRSKRDLRTIQRQLDMLSQHFDIDRDETSRPYGYRWSKGAKGLALPTLSEQESLLLRLAELQFKHLLPDGLMKSLDGFFAQARSNLSADKANTRLEKEWLSKIRVLSTTLPRLAPKVQPGIFEQVSNALYGNRWLTLAYQQPNGETRESKVMPLGLAQQGPRLYLVCRYEGRTDEGTLAMHRITAAMASTQTFERPKGFDLRLYEESGRFAFGEGRQVRLTFLIDKDIGFYLQESPLSADQVVIEHHGKLKVQVTVVESILLHRWLLSYSDVITGIKRKPVHQS